MEMRRRRRKIIKSFGKGTPRIGLFPLQRWRQKSFLLNTYIYSIHVYINISSLSSRNFNRIKNIKILQIRTLLKLNTLNIIWLWIPAKCTSTVIFRFATRFDLNYSAPRLSMQLYFRTHCRFIHSSVSP
jgi:hypothetical protein